MGVYCQIHLDRPPEGVYRPESVVSGAVKYAIDKDTSYRDIIVCLRGKGLCRWSESSGDSTNFYSGHEEYVNVSKSLLDNKTGEAVLVKKGQYSYPFRFDLPSNIPTSYKDGCCMIIYYIKLTFERKDSFNSHKTFRTEIPVVGIVDVTSYRVPIICGERKSLASVVGCGDGIINVKVTAENPVLTSGATAVLDIEVENTTNIKIKAVKTQLLQNVTQISNCGRMNRYAIPIKDAKNEIGSIEEKATASRVSRVQIPEGLISIYCKVLVKEYSLRVKFKLPFPHKSFAIAVPVVIHEGNTTTVAEMVAEDIEQISSEQTTLPDVPPPAYWEVMQEDREMYKIQKKMDI